MNSGRGVGWRPHPRDTLGSARCESDGGGSRARQGAALRRSCSCYGETPSRGERGASLSLSPQCERDSGGSRAQSMGQLRRSCTCYGVTPGFEGRVIGPVRRTADITLGDWGNTAWGAAGREGSPPGSRGECWGLCDEPFASTDGATHREHGVGCRRPRAFRPAREGSARVCATNRLLVPVGRLIGNTAWGAAGRGLSARLERGVLGPVGTR